MLPLLLDRLHQALGTVPTAQDWAITAGLFALFALLYLPIAIATGFLKWQPLGSAGAIGTALQALIYPGLGEEILFRVLLLPYPEAGSWGSWAGVQGSWPWLLGGWLLFWVAHPLNIFERSGTFKRPVFLLGAGLLGWVCMAAYGVSGSVWTAAVLHGVIVALWLTLLGGLEKLQFGWPTRTEIPSP